MPQCVRFLFSTILTRVSLNMISQQLDPSIHEETVPSYTFVPVYFCLVEVKW